MSSAPTDPSGLERPRRVRVVSVFEVFSVFSSVLSFSDPGSKAPGRSEGSTHTTEFEERTYFCIIYLLLCCYPTRWLVLEKSLFDCHGVLIEAH